MPPHYCLFFFFSSRRRHTRWTGDWSSDVCSSDLAGPTLRQMHSGWAAAADRRAQRAGRGGSPRGPADFPAGRPSGRAGRTPGSDSADRLRAGVASFVAGARGGGVMDAAVPFFDLGGMTQEVRSDVDAAWSTLLGTGHFVGGAEVDRFEEEWARYCGTAHAIGVANGTDALTLTLRALAIGAGDEVVVPANTFIATAEAVVLAGATPRFADVDPDTLLLTADGLAAAITSRTSAVIAVHLYGQTADMDAISVTAERAGLAVLEDAAQAHGASWWGRPAGSLGRAGK